MLDWNSEGAKTVYVFAVELLPLRYVRNSIFLCAVKGDVSRNIATCIR